MAGVCFFIFLWFGGIVPKCIGPTPIAGGGFPVIPGRYYRKNRKTVFGSGIFSTIFPNFNHKSHGNNGQRIRKSFFQTSRKMRWEYETPDRQTIITDNKTLWIFRPEDNQVMIGKAPSFFEGGKGFSFLSNMKLIQQEIQY